MGAPIRNTCPDIDRVIKSIQGRIKCLNQIGDIDEDSDFESIDSELDDTIEFLDGLMDEFESIRRSNATLREWGEGLETEQESAAQTISDLDDRVAELEDENERLRETVQSWENSYT